MTRDNQQEGIRREGRMLDYFRPLDHSRMMEALNLLCQRYSFLSVSYMGESIMGRGIPLVTLGEGERTILYVGAHGGREWLGSILLLRMINECCEVLRSDGRLLSYNLRYLFSSRSLCVVPMLNPDGVEYSLHGVERDHVLYDRLLSMNGGEDFSQWDANGRGVTLSRNYGAGFFEQKKKEREEGIVGGGPRGFGGEMAESEPEVAQLCNWLRYREDVSLTLSLEAGRLGVCGEEKKRGLALSRELGCPMGFSERGSMTAWCAEALRIPSFTLRYGEEQGERESFFLYARLRRALFLGLTLL